MDNAALACLRSVGAGLARSCRRWVGGAEVASSALAASAEVPASRARCGQGKAAVGDAGGLLRTKKR